MIEFTLPPLGLVLQAVLSIVLPILVGLVTTRVTSAGTKALLLASLTLVTSGVTELAESVAAGTPWDAGTWLVAALGSFAVSVAVHYGLWKPTGVAGRAQDSFVRAA